MNRSTGATLLVFTFVLLILSGLSANRDEAQPSKPPYPRSKVIQSIDWDFAHRVRRAPGSDLWPMTWAADDNLYTAWGDGGGFGGTNGDGRVSLGFARILGTPERFEATNIWGGKSGERPATFGGKVGALLSVAGTLYAVGGVWPGKGGLKSWSCPKEARLLWSSDLGKTWQVADWTYADAKAPAFGPLSFLNFGKDYAGAQDDFVYLYFTMAWWEWAPRQPPSETYLARVPRNRIKDRAAYEFYRHGRHWTAAFTERRAVFVDRNGRRLSKVIYHPVLKRYLATAAGRSVGQFALFDAPEPWGPWTTALYEDNWGGLGQTEALEFELPTKWMSADGCTLWCVFSSTGALDSFNLVKGTLRLQRN